jgi:tryptophan halogenase
LPGHTAARRSDGVNSVNRIAICGADSVAWLAAIALKRAFQHREIEVTVVESASGSDSCDARWTLPSQLGLHSMIGIEERQLLRSTGATYKLATEYAGFQGEGSRFLHAHGDIGTAGGEAPFYKYLIGESLAGRRATPEEYSLAAAAAKLARFARPVRDNSPLKSSFTYGFHLAEAAYVAYLRAQAERSGIARIDGDVAGFERADDGRVRALRLADGRSVAADFFIQTAQAADDAAPRDDWAAWLPCDRMLCARAPAASNPPPVTRIAAAEAGWTWRVPLAEATSVGYVYSREFLDDAAAAVHLKALYTDIDSPRAAIAFRNGRLRRFWNGNRVSLGAAAMQLEPLAGAGLHFAQIGIAMLIELFPFDASSEVEGVEYDRVMGEHADALRDFTIAHYRAGNPRQGGFWDATRRASLPETLAHKLDLFRANGRIDVRDHESFEETDWAWLLLGAGVVPKSLELQVASRLADERAADAEALRMQIGRLASSMPPHADYLRHQLAAHA